MSQLVDQCRLKDDETYNGAVTNRTSLNAVLDFFFVAGAARGMTPDQLITLFDKALAEDAKLALKALFWVRDIRGGAGERETFRILFNHLWKTENFIADHLMPFIPEFGRWDDVWKSDHDNSSVYWLADQFEILADRRTQHLISKWFPRKGPLFESVRKALNYTPKEMRELLVTTNRVVETKMCKKEWEKIDYSEVPSIASNLYRKAFLRNDERRYTEFIEQVQKGTKDIKAGAIFPHDIIRKIVGQWHNLNYVDLGKQEMDAIQAQWDNLPNYLENNNERIIPMCDVSGSMWTQDGFPMLVSLSLGTYISERNEGLFKDAFITFTDEPKMQYLKGKLLNRLKGLEGAVGYSTNIQKAFTMLLETAVANNLPESEMPAKILVISDMEFDSPHVSGSKTNFDVIKEQYKQAGYSTPVLVFWNVNGRLGNVPAAQTDAQVGLVSGFSPAILTSILSGKSFTPIELMLQTLNSERYELIDW